MKEEFKKYLISEGISSSKIDYYQNQIKYSLTPYILEEREMRSTQIDVFSRLMRDRIIWLCGEVNDNMSSIVQAQLMFLDNQEKKDIRIHIDSPGGSVKSGLSILDVMNYINSDIETINTGLAASMGSVLLSSGTKGKRSSLLHSKVMLHQVSHGTSGNIQDTRITHLQAEKENYILTKILAENCGKSHKELLDFSKRDKWYNSNDALEFGLIDEVVGNRNYNDLLDGFDEHLKSISNI